MYKRLIFAENGGIAGVWGAMNDAQEQNKRWDESGKYMAGFEADTDAQPPEGWAKWTIPAQTYLVADCTLDNYGEVFGKIISEENSNIIGTVQERYPEPGNSNKIELYFPIAAGMLFCQSCAMPMTKPEDFGTEADGSTSRDYCGYCYKKGVFETADTMEQDSGIDFVTVAQAFHWFDRQRFRAECKRILKEKGKVVLLWNMRDETSGLVRENEEIDRIYCPDFKGFSVGMGGESPEKYSDFFKDGICVYNVFPNDLVFDEEGFIGRNLSASYSPKVGEEKYQPYLSALKQLFAKYSNSGYLSMPNFTRTYVGEV